MHGFGTTPNFHAAPFTYHPTPSSGNGGPHGPERRGRSALAPASNTLGPLDLHLSPHATTAVEPTVSLDMWTVLSDSMGDSTTTTSSSMGDVPTPELEAEPPTQALVESSDLSYDKLMDSYFHSNGWEIDQAFNPYFNSFSMVGL